MFALALTLAGLAGTQASAADQFYREDLRIAFSPAGARGLEALLIRPDAPGNYPLALISHGAPRDPSQRTEMTANVFYAQAIEFARRGFAALVVMRRGYGDSGGSFAERSGPCDDSDYVRAGTASSQDLLAAIDAMRSRSDVRTDRFIAVGQSAGGLASVALAANAPPGLAAVINFAGGRGSISSKTVCSADRLVDAFGTFGKTSRMPQLWIYTQNDDYFVPELAQRFHRAFTLSGGKAEFIAAPAFGRDGHTLFARGAPVWTPIVDRFLREQKLGRSEPLPEPPVAALPMPPQLSANGRNDFAAYLQAGKHKAFAVAPRGAYGWRVGRRSALEAREAALAACANFGTDCEIYAVDDEIAKR